MGLWLAGEDPLPEDGKGRGAADACEQHQQQGSSSAESFVRSKMPLNAQQQLLGRLPGAASARSGGQQ